MEISWEWSESKNLLNFRKHKVWFEEAQTIWLDQSSSEFFDTYHSSIWDERFIRVGHSIKNNLLLVVFCEKYNGETIRIISARCATRNERKEHEEGV